MNHVVCVDASVAVKWVIPEDHSASALQLLDEAIEAGVQMVAPPHIIAEVTNAIFKRLRSGELDRDGALLRAASFAGIPLQLVHPQGLMEWAIGLSDDFSWDTPYDAMYLAVGELLDCRVWTADRLFYRDAHAAYPRVGRISDYRAP